MRCGNVACREHTITLMMPTGVDLVLHHCEEAICSHLNTFHIASIVIALTPLHFMYYRQHVITLLV